MEDEDLPVATPGGQGEVLSTVFNRGCVTLDSLMRYLGTETIPQKNKIEDSS